MLLPVLLLYSLRRTDSPSGTDETAEVAADALRADNSWLTAVSVERDGLVATILTRDVAAAAANTAVTVNLRINNCIAVQVGGGYEVWQFLADQSFNRSETTLGHIVLQAKYQVVDDAVAILHDGGTHLYITASHLDKLQSVAPRLDASDAAQLDSLSVRTHD